MLSLTATFKQYFNRCHIPRILSKTILLLGVTAVIMTSCNVPIDENAQAIDIDNLPESLRPGVAQQATTNTEPPEAFTNDHTVFLLTNPQDTERTVVVEVKRQVPPNASLSSVLSTLFGKSTTPEEQAQGFFNTLELFEMKGVRINDAIATVDIAPLSIEDTVPSETLRLAAAQLVFTVSVWGVEKTRILLDGTEVSIPTSDADAEPGSELQIDAYEQFRPER